MDRNTKGLLAIMLNGFPQSQNTDGDALMLGLEMALEGISDQAIVEMCKRFMRGEVDGHDVRFAPSIPAMVKEAKSREEWIRLSATPRPRLPAPKPEPVISPEERARVAEKMKAFAASLHDAARPMVLAEEKRDGEPLHISPERGEFLVKLLEEKAAKRGEVQGSA